MGIVNPGAPLHHGLTSGGGDIGIRGLVKNSLRGLRSDFQKTKRSTTVPDKPKTFEGEAAFETDWSKRRRGRRNPGKSLPHHLGNTLNMGSQKRRRKVRLSAQGGPGSNVYMGSTKKTGRVINAEETGRHHSRGTKMKKGGLLGRPPREFSR